MLQFLPSHWKTSIIRLIHWHLLTYKLPLTCLAVVLLFSLANRPRIVLIQCLLTQSFCLMDSRAPDKHYISSFYTGCMCKFLAEVYYDWFPSLGCEDCTHRISWPQVNFRPHSVIGPDNWKMRRVPRSRGERGFPSVNHCFRLKAVLYSTFSKTHC